ncbi:hypothetical protein [Arthrobacter globiformis]|uniref:hypothetical protein n=1 Tax=Arthrobacter globiformis TaxID=1665 RepID=UPI0027D7DF03|nr:hypothetical protein [Arthrobacter globiformis]
MLQIAMGTQIAVAVGVAFGPETSFRDRLWPLGPVVAIAITASIIFSPLLERVVRKDDGRLSDEQSAAMEGALRTGAPPLVSLFADWGPALEKRRRDLVSGRWLGLILMAVLIALNVFDSCLDPEGIWFYWISAVFYAVLAITGVLLGRRKIRRILVLKSQLEELRGESRQGLSS